MKLPAIVMSFLLASIGTAHAGEKPIARNADTEASVAATQYLIALSEYQLEKPIPAGVSEDDILKFIVDSKATPVQTVQMTASADTQTMVNFGKQVTVTTGKVVVNGSISRQTQQMVMGTTLSVAITSHGKGAVADIDYSTKRFDGDGTEDSPPNVLTTSTQSSQVFELGKQRLLVSASGRDSSCIVVTVNTIP